MKVKFLPILLAISLVLALKVFAQLPNTGFETWVPSGNPPPFDWEEPESWKSNNETTEFTMAGIRKDTDAQEGTYAAKIMTSNVFGTFTPGVLCNGTPQSDFPNYTVRIATGGTPLSTKPGKLKGYYKFTAPSAGDSAYVVVILKKYNTAAGKADTVALGTKTLAPATAYIAFEVLVNDLASTQDPDSIIAAFYSSKPSAPLEGGQLFVDNISLDFTAGLKESLNSSVRLYPNPAAESIRLELEGITRVESIRLYDLQGKVVASFLAGSRELPIVSLAAGTYLLMIRTDKGVLREKIVKE